TLPLVTMQFHVFAPIGVPASLVVIPLVTVALAMGMAYLLLGSLLPALDEVLGPLSGLLFEWLDGVVNWSSSWPLSHWWTPGPAGWWVVGYYAILALLLGTGGVRGGWQRLAQVMALWIVVGVAPAVIVRLVPRPFEVAFLD